MWMKKYCVLTRFEKKGTKAMKCRSITILAKALRTFNYLLLKDSVCS